jgi:tmRNA-binding protein
LTTNEGRESGRTEAIFGNQAVVVNNANYVETIMSYMRMTRGAVHTISLYAKKPAAYSAGIPRIYLYVYNEGLGGSKTVLWSTTLTANSAPPSDYRPARYIFNFTMPNITSGVDTYTQFGIRVLSSNSNWVIIDGIQLVEGAIAGPYDAENSFFDFMNGYLPVRRLNSTGEIIARGWVYTDAIDSNPYSSGIHLYLRPTSSGEVRATRTGTTDSYVPVRASNVYTNSVDINNLTSGVNLYLRPTSSGEVRATRTGTTDSYVPVRASNVYTNSVDINNLTSGVNLYLRPTSSGEVRATRTGTTDSYVPVRASNVYTNSVDINNLTSGVNLYLRPTSSGEVRATVTGTTDSYVPVRASSFPTASLAEYKEDIQPWTDSALEKIRNATIYEYYLKSELEQGIQRKRQGLVIGEGYNTPAGVVDGDGVEQYLLNAWSWKAIQELDSIQMNHEDRIAQLEQKIAELEAKIG